MLDLSFSWMLQSVVGEFRMNEIKEYILDFLFFFFSQENICLKKIIRKEEVKKKISALPASIYFRGLFTAIGQRTIKISEV